MKQKNVSEKSIAKLKAQGVNLNGAIVVGVPAASKFLGVSERRVRTFISPECRCVIRKRRRGLAPKPESDCPYCDGTGLAVSRLKAVRMPDGKYIVGVDDLVNFANEKRPGGRPAVSTV